MDKQQIISFIEGQLATGKISKDDLATLVGTPVAASATPASQTVSTFSSPSEPVKEDNNRNLTHIFYAIGAVIAIVGVGILVAQNWEAIGFAGRILVTLGLALITYIIGFAVRSPEQRTLSQVMFTMSAALAPLGTFVLLEQANVDFTLNAQLMTGIIFTVIFGTALFITKRNILMLITVGYASWAYYTLILRLFDNLTYIDGEIMKWATMILGIAFIGISYGFKSWFPPIDRQDEKEKHVIQNLLYGIGTIGILGAAISIGGVWDLITIALIFGAFYGSVYLKSRMMLSVSALFLMGHIIKLTGKYFVDSIGWPIALIAVGFLIIGVGYMTISLNKKFIGKKV